MKSLSTVRSLVFVLATGLIAAPVLAADAPAKPLTPQQQKFGDCSKEASAKGLKGDDFKNYVGTCAKAAPAAPAKPMTQQEKMKACNADPQAKTLKGDERKAFMKSCLSGSAAPAA